MTQPYLSRDLLAKHFKGDLRMIAEFENQDEAVREAAGGVEATAALKDATVIVLSANGEFVNERVLEVSDDIEVEVTPTAVRLKVKDVARTRDHGATFVPPAEVLLFLPPEGTLLSDAVPLRATVFGNFADDTAAAAGGVPVGGVYRNGSALMVRVT